MEIKTMKFKIMLVGLVAVLMFIVSTDSYAQGDAKMAMHKSDKSPMSEMMNSSHHKMGMAYRKNLNTLATTLVDLSTGTDAVNHDLVKAIVADIKNASGMMNRIHMDHMGKMKPEMKSKMAPMMEKMKTKREKLANHIKALETAANTDAFDMKEIGMHAAAIAELTSSHDMKRKHKEKMKMDGMNRDK